MKLKKIIACGVFAGMLSFGILTSVQNTYGMSNRVWGAIDVHNPIYSKPYATARTTGKKTIKAICTAIKTGETTRSTDAVKNVGNKFGKVETGKLYGPTYKAAGTLFRGQHEGTAYDGSYEIVFSSYQY